MKIMFVRKPTSLDEVIHHIAMAHEMGIYDECAENCYIAEEVTLSEIEWRSLARAPLKDRDWIAAFTKRNYPVVCNSVYPCIRVTCKSDTRVLIIDPQGYDYARYIGIEENPDASK